MMLMKIVSEGMTYMATKRQIPVGPVLIMALFGAFFVFLLVTRIRPTEVSHPQPVTQNR